MTGNEAIDADQILKYRLEYYYSRIEDLYLLIRGNKELGLKLLKALYEKASQNPNYLCSFHDASQIKSAKDFFVPLLKVRFGEEYNKVLSSLEDTVENILDAYDADCKTYGDGTWGVGDAFDVIVHYICQNKTGERENDRKKLLIFVDGLEELFFNLDYRNNADFLKTNAEDYFDEEKDGSNLDKMSSILLFQKYTTKLRAAWHQRSESGVMLNGLVRNISSVECRTTLQNYDYLFYGGNFCPIWME